MNAVHAYNYTVGARLRVSDEDAADFLQSQFSQELRPFEAGQCTYGLWLDVKGKVIADSWVLCEGPEAFWVLSEHAIASELQAKLERHIIADDVCIEVSPARSACALIGTDAAALLEAATKGALAADSLGAGSPNELLYVHHQDENNTTNPAPPPPAPGGGA